jgi:hypothetical protein
VLRVSECRERLTELSETVANQLPEATVKTTTDPRAVFDDDTESVTVTIKPTADGFAVCDGARFDITTE